MTDRAHLDLILLLEQFPDDATVTLSVSGLDRDAFDGLPGSDGDGPVLGTWMKRTMIGRVRVEFYSSGAPISTTSTVAARYADGRPLAVLHERRPDLRRVK